jgi:hypothetical protein
MTAMRRKINVYETLLVIVLLIVALAALYAAAGYSAKGKLFPLIVTILLIVMLAVKLLSLLSPRIGDRIDIQGIEFPDTKSKSSPKEDHPAVKEAAKWTKELMMLFWLLFLMACIYLIGFLAAIPMFLFLFLKFQGKHGWLTSILVSVAVLVFIYGLFGVVLSVEFPQGLFFSE